jgi:hypothetical protein
MAVAVIMLMTATVFGLASGVCWVRAQKSSHSSRGLAYDFVGVHTILLKIF